MNYPANWKQFDDHLKVLSDDPSSYMCCSSSNEVPLNLMPYLGNGFIGTQPKSPWIFMDGLYNGEATGSHRARIPSPFSWLLRTPLCIDEGGLYECQHSQEFWMHFGMGLFTQRLTSVNNEVSMTTFVSRQRPSLLVRIIEARFFTRDILQPEPLLLQPDLEIQFESPDCVINIVGSVDPKQLLISGQCFTSESHEFQREPSSFYLHTDVVPEELAKGFYLSPTTPRRIFLTTLSRTSMEDATAQYESALSVAQQLPNQLLVEQADSWRRVWEEGCIRLCCSDTSCQLSGIVLAAQYSLLTCLPDPRHTLQPPFPTQPACSFYGLCPTGLARGAEEDDYMARSRVLGYGIMDASLALDYRYAMLPAAERRAVAENLEGARFPWESAFTGIETTPWQLAADNQIHVNGAVSFAVQQWLSAHAASGLRSEGCTVLPQSNPVTCVEEFTGERAISIEDPETWYNTRGRSLLEHVARFWCSRAVYSLEKMSFELLDVMPPDEYTHCCRNSAYTNAIASISLSAPAKFARLFAAVLPLDYTKWEKMAMQIWMPRDSNDQLMLEHENYVLGTCVKQADTILLTYPLLFDQPEVWKRNMVNYYARVTDTNGPAMTWSIFCICALELKDFDRAVDFFERSLLHVRQPYWSWTETKSGSGAANFLTGVGGFLQSIVNGFAGLRIRLLSHQTVNCGCANSYHMVPALTLCPWIPTQFRSSWHSVRLHSLHFQTRRLTICMDLSRDQWTIELIEGQSVLVGQLMATGTWVFEKRLNIHNDPLQLRFQPICLVACDSIKLPDSALPEYRVCAASLQPRNLSNV
ncbi:Glycosyl hydrolase family 65 central catalytic domain protein [Paragonimus heterotremus]|uniref:Glycosyl hydrolase family 65 central catalytic domain protein n=1 Tax=Paragonimus heterotremus TaxID=100268 RepID=A0A8J4WJ76_9TREM|nr:Glycosyl hydrolase family 65 central catalytic domain protein [Paragonimus heterotremus]